MARGVDKVELIDLAVTRLVMQGHRLGLNGDSSLALEVHRVENLVLHLAVGQASAELNHSICKRAFSVINVGND